MSNNITCDLCFPNAKIGDISDGYELMFYEDKYHIISGNGHLDDILVTFKEKPKVDHDPECLTDDDSWFKIFEAFEDDLKLEPREAYNFVSSCLKSGYNINDNFSYWLLNKAGEIIERS